MKEWQKEMITTIMNSKSEDSIAETIAEIITANYTDTDLYMDELANELYLYDPEIAEELKDDIDNTIDIQKGDK